MTDTPPGAVEAARQESAPALIESCLPEPTSPPYVRPSLAGSLALPLPKTPPHHVAIVGMGGSCAEFVHQANGLGSVLAVADEIWAINATAAVLQHHRVFVMDDMKDTIPKEAREGRKVAAQILNWLPNHPGPVYTSTAYPEWPALVEYPLRDVLQSLGGFPYLNTSVAHAIAYAMHIGVKHLSMYGCDFTYPNLHIAESGRGCAEFLLGVFTAKGGLVTLPQTTTLFDSNVREEDRIYGYPRGTRVRMAGEQVHVQHGPFPPPAPPTTASGSFTPPTGTETPP